MLSRFGGLLIGIGLLALVGLFSGCAEVGKRSTLGGGVSSLSSGGAGGGGSAGADTASAMLFLFSGVQGGATLEIPCEPFAGVPVAGVPAYGFPIEDGSGVISATFCDPIYQSAFGKQHLGLDIAADEGKIVITTMAGRVIRSEFDNQFGMGWNLKVCDDAGWCFVYQHLMEQPIVNVNDVVSKGQQVGKVGTSGSSTNPHLHYQLEAPGGIAIDPVPTLGR